RTLNHPGEPEKTRAVGIARQATTMKTSQIFSHFHRGSSFMGVVNRPLNRPDSTANAIPVVISASKKLLDKVTQHLRYVYTRCLYNYQIGRDKGIQWWSCQLKTSPHSPPFGSTRTRRRQSICRLPKASAACLLAEFCLPGTSSRL